ncbi:kekkon 5 [Carabus blaptoides fortunei]
MADNYISSIGMHALPNTTTLKELHIHENKLQYINSSLLDQFKQLTRFSLYGNPWYCDCRLEQLHDIWQNHTTFTYPQCAGPAKLHNLTWDKITSDDMCSQPTSEEPITENVHSTTVENMNNSLNNCNLSSDEQRINIISVRIGRNVIFKCKICARKVQWLYGNNIIHDNSISGSGLQYVAWTETENHTVTFRLMIIDARIEDGGTYTCRALNSQVERNYILKLFQVEKDIEHTLIIFGPLSFAILLFMLFIFVIVILVKKYKNRNTPGLCDLSLKSFEKVINEHIDIS